MARVEIKTKSGTVITVEGSPEEVALVVKKIEGEAPSQRHHERARDKEGAEGTSKPTPLNLISSLIDGGFFRKPKDLASVKVALEEMGHFYPVTTLSPALLRLVRRRELRRLRDNKRWLYTGGGQS
jgi:hypothetical protein